MIEEGCYIDNSAGIYTQREVCERLVDLGRYVGAKLGRWPIGKLPEDEIERSEWLHEIEYELWQKVAEHLTRNHGQRLELFDGAYCIVEDTDEED